MMLYILTHSFTESKTTSLRVPETDRKLALDLLLELALQQADLNNLLSIVVYLLNKTVKREGYNKK